MLVAILSIKTYYKYLVLWGLTIFMITNYNNLIL